MRTINTTSGGKQKKSQTRTAKKGLNNGSVSASAKRGTALGSDRSEGITMNGNHKKVSLSDYSLTNESASCKEYALSDKALNSIPKRSRNGIPKTVRIHFPTDKTARKELSEVMAEAIAAVMKKTIRG